MRTPGTAALQADLICPSCSGDNLRHSKFCRHCGSRFAAEALSAAEADKLLVDLTAGQAGSVVWLGGIGDGTSSSGEPIAPGVKRGFNRTPSSGDGRAAAFDLNRVALTGLGSFAALAFLVFIVYGTQLGPKAAPASSASATNQAPAVAATNAKPSVQSNTIIAATAPSFGDPSALPFKITNVKSAKPSADPGSRPVIPLPRPLTLSAGTEPEEQFLEPWHPLAAPAIAPRPAAPAFSAVETGGRSVNGAPLDTTGANRIQTIGATGEGTWAERYRQSGVRSMENRDYTSAAQDFRVAIAYYHFMLRRGERVEDARAGLAAAQDGLSQALSPQHPGGVIRPHRALPASSR